jgi:hypothetical protein
MDFKKQIINFIKKLQSKQLSIKELKAIFSFQNIIIRGKKRHEVDKTLSDPVLPNCSLQKMDTKIDTKITNNKKIKEIKKIFIAEDDDVSI